MGSRQTVSRGLTSTSTESSAGIGSFARASLNASSPCRSPSRFSYGKSVRLPSHAAAKRTTLMRNRPPNVNQEKLIDVGELINEFQKKIRFKMHVPSNG